MSVADLARDPSFVGPYRVIGTLGEGGMGVVHLALDPVGRAVAVKVLRPQVAGDAIGRRRLGREVDSLRRVRHPNVAEVLDADLEGPSPYVVTVFVPARTLEHQVREHGALPAPYVAHLGRVMIGALRAIHGAGVVHRDVKPANVLLLDDAPILIDFGIAHVVDESRITVAGLVMGTPGYLPPELIEGQPITPATDWWAWGATLAYAATGRAPFGSGPATVVLDRVRRGEADLDGVDPGIARVLAMALNVNPVWRGTGEMLLAGLSTIEPWRPGRRPFAPALTPDEVRTIPLAAAPAAPPPPPPPPPLLPPPPLPLRATTPMPVGLVPTDVVSAPVVVQQPAPASVPAGVPSASRPVPAVARRQPRPGRCRRGRWGPHSPSLWPPWQRWPPWRRAWPSWCPWPGPCWGGWPTARSRARCGAATATARARAMWAWRWRRCRGARWPPSRAPRWGRCCRRRSR